TAIIMITFTEPAAGQPGRVDYAGIGVLAGAAAVLMLLLFWGGQAIPWRSPAAAGLAAVFAALVVLFIRVERRTPQPFLPFSLFADRVMAVGSAGGFLLGASMFSAVVYIPLFVQGVIGTSATTAGIVLMPFMLCWTFGSIAGGRLALRWGYRPVTIAGMVMLAAGFARLARLEPQALVQDVFASMAVLGVRMGLTATIFMISMQNAVPRPMRGIATSITLFSRNIGSAIGVSLQGAVLVGVLAGRMRTIAGGVPGTGLPRITDPQMALDAAVQAHLTPAGHEAVRQALAHGLHATLALRPGAVPLRPAARLAEPPPARPPRADSRARLPRAGRDADRRLLRADPRDLPRCRQARPDREADPRGRRGIRRPRGGPLARRTRLGTAPGPSARRSGRPVHDRGRHPFPCRGARRAAAARLLPHRGGGGAARDLSEPEAAAVPDSL